MKKLFITIIFLLTAATFLNATILVTNTSKEIALLKHSEIFLDKKEKENIHTLMNQPELFTPYHKEFINEGIKNNYSAWVKFTLENNSTKTIERTINVDEVQIEHITLYTTQKGEILNKEQSGSFHRKEFNGILMHYFQTTLEPQTQITYYLQVSSPSTALSFRAYLSSHEEFIYKDIQYHMVWGLFIAVLLTVLVYNILLFFFTKDSLYFYYALYILGILATKKVHYLIWLHIFPMHDPIAVQTEFSLIVYYTNFTALTMILFTQKFLHTKTYPKLHIFLNTLVMLIIIHSVITRDDFITYKDVAFFYLALLIFFFFVGFYALYKKNKNAIYFIFGWGLSVFAWLSTLLHGLNIWSSKYFFYYLTETFITLEVFLFSYAISRYISELNKEKATLSQKLIEQKENENIKLEQSVNEKTQSLNEELKTNQFLLQELNHRVKNNMQFITSLYSLKLSNSNQSNITERLRDVERKVDAMSQLHQMLYTQENLQSINADYYFEKIVQTIKESFQQEKIQFLFNIEATLKIEEAIYCGLIVNELVTNAVKYAFPNHEGEITIMLFEDATYKYLAVADNGVGIGSQESQGFGQTLIETLCVEQLNGEMTINTSKGTSVEIKFKK